VCFWPGRDSALIEDLRESWILGTGYGCSAIDPALVDEKLGAFWDCQLWRIRRGPAVKSR
jgi:hypothetical protein